MIGITINTCLKEKPSMYKISHSLADQIPINSKATCLAHFSEDCLGIIVGAMPGQEKWPKFGRPQRLVRPEVNQTINLRDWRDSTYGGGMWKWARKSQHRHKEIQTCVTCSHFLVTSIMTIKIENCYQNVNIKKHHLFHILINDGVVIIS